jgi:peptidyl-prolyl cis-trans isomerase C
VAAVAAARSFGLAAAARSFGPAVAAAQPGMPEPDVPTRPPQPPGQLTAEERARRAKVVAKIGDVRLTVGEVEDAINAQSPFLRTRYRDPARLEEFVDNMIRFELLAREAERRGYGDNEIVQRSVGQNAVQQLIRREFDERITPEKIPAEDVRAYYDGHDDEFHRAEMLRASHILVAEREEAVRLLEKARGGDLRRFRELARQHSVDTETKLRGGDLRYFTREGRPPTSQDAPVAAPIVAAAFGLRNIGDLAPEPVAVGENFSVVMLTGRRPAEERPFEQAEQGIRLKLWRERRQEEIDRFVTRLRERYRPVVHNDRMRPIRLDPVEPGPGFDPHSDEEEPPSGVPGLDEPGGAAEDPPGGPGKQP